MQSIEQRIAKELNVQPSQISVAMSLLAEGATVPFIARYRKEKTGGLDDTQLRKLDDRLGYLRQLDERKAAILKSITEQGKLTTALRHAILSAESKVDLEDLYAPFKQKRRTKAQIAREAGLEPLADALLANPSLDPIREATKYCRSDNGVADPQTALDGARSILVERISVDPELVGSLRARLWNDGQITSRRVKGKEAVAIKFSDYFDFRQPIRDIPSHRVLALLRGRNEGFLKLTIDMETKNEELHPGELTIRARFGIANRSRRADAWLAETARVAWKTKLHPSLTTNLLGKMQDQAEAAAIDIFKSNLKDLLLAAPAGPRTTMGLDPGIRTGVKVAVVDPTGKLLDSATVYPHEPRNDWQGAMATLSRLCTKHNVDLIAIGNGTASRETDKLVGDLIRQTPQLKITKVMVSEAGASVYSASKLAAEEFPNLDVSLRGAVSIARRLQDPLAELVKIEPKSIGVGQYQHDVDQSQLARSLNATVEDCVNSVGVDVNTASAPLLTSVAGLNTTIAHNIIQYRNENGPFKKRSEIKKVARLGPKAFEQAAGFLRITNGRNILDASAVHPEAYPVVERIAATTNRSIQSMIGDSVFLKSLKPKDFADSQFGVPTVSDILAELEKPGRDPRPEFNTARFAEGVEKITDLAAGMLLEGVVTNVTAFGAFVDVGVHQDGLVHISQLADRFVKDPREVVKAGDVVKVRVIDIDTERKRISLTMKSTSSIDMGRVGGLGTQNERQPSHSATRHTDPLSSDRDSEDSALAAALQRAQGSRNRDRWS